MFDILIEGSINIPHFLGVFTRDTLPQIKSYPASLVSNVEKDGELGTHWIAIFFHKSRRGEYFDSYGLPPLYPEFIEYLQTYSIGFIWNKIVLQCSKCVTCGEYSSAYIILRTFNWTYGEFISLFTTNQFSNDYIIKSLHKSLLKSNVNILREHVNTLRKKIQNTK